MKVIPKQINYWQQLAVTWELIKAGGKIFISLLGCRHTEVATAFKIVWLVNNARQYRVR